MNFRIKQLTISTIDTSINTVATYNGPIFTLASSSISSDFHDYEVGQEVNIYGFQNSAIDFGSSTNSAYSITGGLITVQVTGVDNTKTSAFFGNCNHLDKLVLHLIFLVLMKDLVRHILLETGAQDLELHHYLATQI